MKFFTSVVILMVALISGYVISTHRYTAVGCGIATKWDDRVNNHIESLLVAIALMPIAVLVYGPVMWLYARLDFDVVASRLSASALIILIALAYCKLLSEMMGTGEHNGKLRAEKAAKRHKKHCQIECEYASWGETILECQNPTCLNCPLMEQYDIKPRIYRHDILESVYRHERIERTMRRRGQTVPSSYVISIPIERVLTKVFDVEGWYDGFTDAFVISEEPARTGTCNIIPFPVQPKVEEEPKPEPEPVVFEGEIVEDKPEPVRRHSKYSKVVVNRGDHGVKIEDCGTYLSICLAWTDESGKPQRGEYTLDKNSPDCLYLMDDVAAIDLNAALKLQAMAIPAEIL